MAHSATSKIGELSRQSTSTDECISSSLKFVVSNLKNIVPNQLSTDNYVLWQSQIQKLLRANGFDQFLDLSCPPPPSVLRHPDDSTSTNPAYTRWFLIDQNLAAAIGSTISPSVLPHIIHLDSTASIWDSLERRFQSTNRSRVIQLKNELHNVMMKNSSMTLYLLTIKTLVDQISSAGSSIDDEDVILYTLNGLPPSYQALEFI